mmetsp:Transcript_23787/g.66442  ORF Transcript_23787/g.66442 Transcript_23787/m.66442 type:complete len:216 (+) Transcript_23787:146-793(+)
MLRQLLLYQRKALMRIVQFQDEMQLAGITAVEQTDVVLDRELINVLLRHDAELHLPEIRIGPCRVDPFHGGWSIEQQESLLCDAHGGAVLGSLVYRDVPGRSDVALDQGTRDGVFAEQHGAVLVLVEVVGQGCWIEAAEWESHLLLFLASFGCGGRHGAAVSCWLLVAGCCLLVAGCWSVLWRVGASKSRPSSIQYLLLAHFLAPYLCRQQWSPL